MFLYLCIGIKQQLKSKAMITLDKFKSNLKNLGLIILSQVCAAIFMFALYLLTLIF